MLKNYNWTQISFNYGAAGLSKLAIAWWWRLQGYVNQTWNMHNIYIEVNKDGN